MPKDIKIDEQLMDEVINNPGIEKQLKMKEGAVKIKRSQSDRERELKKLIEKEEDDARNLENLYDAYHETGERVVDPNDSKKPGSWWDLVLKKANGYANAGGQYSYVEWSTAMMNIFQLCVFLQKALAYDKTMSKTAEYFWDNTMGSTSAGKAMENIAKGIIPKLREKGRDVMDLINQYEKANAALRKMGYKLPFPDNINYRITIGADGKLSSELIFDGVKIEENPDDPVYGQVKLEFDTGLAIWLQQNRHYRINRVDSQTHTVTHQDGTNLSEEELKDLMTDNANGLRAFFINQEGVAIQPEFTIESPRMR